MRESFFGQPGNPGPQSQSLFAQRQIRIGVLPQVEETAEGLLCFFALTFGEIIGSERVVSRQPELLRFPPDRQIGETQKLFVPGDGIVRFSGLLIGTLDYRRNDLRLWCRMSLQGEGHICFSRSRRNDFFF